MLCTMLSAFKVSDEVVKQYLWYIQMYIIIIHTICVASLFHNDYAGILVFLPLIDWQLVYVVSTQSMPWLTLHL